MGKTDKLIQSRNQQASTKSIKMSPFLFFTVLIVAASGFEVNQKTAAGYFPGSTCQCKCENGQPSVTSSGCNCDCQATNERDTVEVTPTTIVKTRRRRLAPPLHPEGTCACWYNWIGVIKKLRNNCAAGYIACWGGLFECNCDCKKSC